MRMNQIISESEQLDELSTADVGRAVGKGIGGLAKGLGAIPGALVGAGQAFKQGYQQAKGTVSGRGTPQDLDPDYYRPRSGVRTVAATRSSDTEMPSGAATTTTAATGGAASSLTADEIIQALPNLSPEDKESIKKALEAPVEPEPTGAAPTSTSAPVSAPGASRPSKNQIITGPDGKPYQWLGAQWALYNPSTGRAGMTAAKAVGDELTKLVASGKAQEYTPPAKSSTGAPSPSSGGRPLPSPAASSTPPPGGRPISATGSTPPAAPANAKTPEQEWEERMRAQGLSDEEIEKARGPYRARQNRTPRRQDPAGSTLPPSRPAARPTDYDWVPGGGVGPNTRLGSVGPVGRRSANEGIEKVGIYTANSGEIFKMIRSSHDPKHYMLVNSKGQVVKSHHGDPEEFHQELRMDGLKGSYKINESSELFYSKFLGKGI